MLVCTSSKTSYNVLGRLGTESNYAYRGGGVGGLIVDIRGGNAKERVSMQILDFQRLASLLIWQTLLQFFSLFHAFFMTCSLIKLHFPNLHLFRTCLSLAFKVLLLD